MLSPQQCYDLGRDHFIAGLRMKHCPFSSSDARELYQRGQIQERNDQEDILTVLRKAVK